MAMAVREYAVVETLCDVPGCDSFHRLTNGTGDPDWRWGMEWKFPAGWSVRSGVVLCPDHESWTPPNAIAPEPKTSPE
jgi:hypothetical protein